MIFENIKNIVLDESHMGQSIQEWVSKICGRRPLKNLKGYRLLKQTIFLQIFYRLSSTNLTWSALEYFDSYEDIFIYYLAHKIPYSISRPYPLCLSRPYPFRFFKGFLPQILLGPLLNTFSHMKIILWSWSQNTIQYKLVMYYLTLIPSEESKRQRCNEKLWRNVW